MHNIDIIVNRIIKGEKLQREQLIGLLEYSTENLLYGANRLKDYFFDNDYELCAIINGKSGRCSENCKFCAQSSYYKTEVTEYDVLDEKTILVDAQTRADEGIKRYSIVTSGRRLSKKEVAKVSKIYKALNENVDIKLCASHGLLDYDDFVLLKASGVARYHNNLETSRNNFTNICTTHTYDDKIKSIREAKQAGLTVCSGGIFGLGESYQDRIDMLLDIRALDVDSVPLNILNAVKGTPFEINGLLGYDEILRSMAIARFILPDKVIRLAGGRGLLSDKGKQLFEMVVNGAISGDLLTTAGVNTEYDTNLLKSIGKRVALIEK